MLQPSEVVVVPARALPAAFYRRDDVVQVSRELLGKVLCTRVNGAVTKAVITETEAYAGVGDKASHAYGGRRTRRTEPMYAAGGIAYVYLCYGIHHLFNVVSGGAGTPHAILVRAARPLEGVSLMKKRRGKSATEKTLMPGPGTVSQALGITTKLTGSSLQGGRIWIEDHDVAADAVTITVGPRVGVDYAAEDAARPYRFLLKESSE
ncbi:MAG TPA: DNA-3-methyladenine glycosylase [Woeseiaceae bacterium]|nr:DNA-3-methyladenine glycosylase [Woeseiaceae bacterium]